MKVFFQLSRVVLGVVTLVVFGLIQANGGIDAVGVMLLKAISICAISWVLLVILDVSYHTFQGKGQACPYCGELRQMASFRMYPTCKKCGK